MPFYVWLIVFHPVLLTLVVGLGIMLLLRRRLWPKYKWIILGAAGAAYLVDAALAVPRVAYGWSLPSQPVIARKIAVPKTLVVIHAGCHEECQKWLASGVIDEAIVVDRDFPRDDDQAPVRYRANWVSPGQCPFERWRKRPAIIGELSKRGFCPTVEETVLPTDGVFLVSEAFLVTSRTRARKFKSRYLTTSPPGRTIDFFGQEVQVRTNGKIDRVAGRYVYSAPGFTGLPPLLGCWDRPDNIIWIMPPGDTVCGFWRWFTWGGDRKWMRGDTAWIYRDVFEAPPNPQ